MVAGLKVGDLVHICGEKIRFLNWASNNLGSNWRKVKINGIATGFEGEGRSKKFCVQFSHPTDPSKNINATQTLRSLEKGHYVR